MFLPRLFQVEKYWGVEQCGLTSVGHQKFFLGVRDGSRIRYDSAQSPIMIESKPMASPEGDLGVQIQC
jgi:hypothetical protein